MRITCPNCGAQYEVPDEVIPQDGRDVQCSNCGMTWFQAHPDFPPPEPAEKPAEVNAAPAADDSATHEAVPPMDDMGEDIADGQAPPVQDAPVEPDRRGLDHDVAEILRQEAEHEAELRAAEAQSGLESQPDLGLDDLPRTVSSAEETEPGSVGTAGAGGSSRRDFLPDVDELNTALRSEGDSTALTPHLSDGDETPVQDAGKAGFSRGFALTLVLAALIVVIYANAPAISEKVPQVDGFLNALVTLIDKGRLWLDTQVRAFVS
ncbi:MAG: zinc-ribbon domain-containing protein [Marinibacterium sp.]